MRKLLLLVLLAVFTHCKQAKQTEIKEVITKVVETVAPKLDTVPVVIEKQRPSLEGIADTTFIPVSYTHLPSPRDS